MNKLNDEQRRLVEQHKKYIEKLAWKWIKAKRQINHADDLLSLSYYFLVRSASKYKSGEVSFAGYLSGGIKFMYRYLQSYINSYYMVSQKENLSIVRRVEVSQYYFEEYLEAENAIYQEENFDEILNQSRLLKEKEKKVLKETFIEEKTFAQIGRENNVSREYIRQVYNSAISKLRKVIK